jgi:hypothetical protein
MDGVEGMLRSLKLSEAERARVKVGGAGLLRRRGGEDEKVVGKLLSEKQAHAGAIADTLGPIWCPMKGVCKDLGENKFLFTFFQEGGRKKAVEEGPWTFDKALIVMESFDPCKTLDEYKFAQIPIWVRIYKLPLGLMDRDTCMAIGDQIGEYMEMDGVEDGMAVGKCLRVKVKKNLEEPLMRGTTVVVDEQGQTKWCPVQYEFLPDFCFICGMIGHIDRGCSIKLKRGEEPQFGKWLKWIPQRRVNQYTNQQSWSDKGGRRIYNLGSNGSKSGSEGLTWRKD